MKNIIYCRRSSDDSTHQVLSIESQEREIVALAERNQSKVNKIFRESMSAKQPGAKAGDGFRWRKFFFCNRWKDYRSS